MINGTIKSVAGGIRIFQDFIETSEIAVSETEVLYGKSRTETPDNPNGSMDETVQFALSAWKILSQ